jgi:hypothetical protein
MYSRFYSKHLKERGYWYMRARWEAIIKVKLSCAYFLRSTGSGMGSTQPRGYNLGAT